MAESKLLNRLSEDFLECQICLQPYRRPKVLSCLHSFCQKCLEEFLKKQKVKTELDCPTCRSKTLLPGGGVAELKDNFFVESLKDTVDVHKKLTNEGESLVCGSCETKSGAESFCTECGDFLCDECVAMHRRIKLKAESDNVKIKPRPLPPCRIHSQETLKFFCIDCSEVICQVCTVLSHKDHKYEYFADTAVKAKEDILALLAKTERKLENLKKADQQAQAQKTELEKNVTETIEKIKRTSEETKENLVKLVNQQETVSYVNTVSQTRSKEFSIAIEEIETATVALESAAEFGRNIVEHGSEFDIMAVSVEVSGRLNKLLLEEPAEDYLLAKKVYIAFEADKTFYLTKPRLGLVKTRQVSLQTFSFVSAGATLFPDADALMQKATDFALGGQDSTSEKAPTDLSHAQSPEKGWPQLSTMTFGASLTSGPDVETIYEKTPSAMQLTHALKYRLPPTFYFYEDLPVLEGYRPDEDFDDYEIWFDQWKAGKALRKDAPQPVQTTSTPTKDQAETSAIGTSSFGGTTTKTDTGLFEGLSFSFGKLFTSTSAVKGFGASTTETKGGLFGTVTSTGGLFGTSTSTAGTGLFATPQQQTAPFGTANKTVTVTGFGGFGTQSFSTATSAGPFGASQQTPSSFGAGLIKSTGLSISAAETMAFCGTEAGPTGTTVKFNPVSGSDTMMRNGVSQNVRTAHQSIVAMEEYETKSLEELRMEDYLGNRKGGSTGATALFKLAATPQAKGDLSGTNASSTRLRLRARRKSGEGLMVLEVGEEEGVGTQEEGGGIIHLIPVGVEIRREGGILPLVSLLTTTTVSSPSRVLVVKHTRTAMKTPTGQIAMITVALSSHVWTMIMPTMMAAPKISNIMVLVKKLEESSPGQLTTRVIPAANHALLLFKMKLPPGQLTVIQIPASNHTQLVTRNATT
ncbi:uncharacterized protein LOC144883603 [Branchiostoma floridae x Branchiostoma japonicum]